MDGFLYQIEHINETVIALPAPVEASSRAQLPYAVSSVYVLFGPFL